MWLRSCAFHASGAAPARHHSIMFVRAAPPRKGDDEEEFLETAKPGRIAIGRDTAPERKAMPAIRELAM